MKKLTALFSKKRANQHPANQEATHFDAAPVSAFDDVPTLTEVVSEHHELWEADAGSAVSDQKGLQSATGRGTGFQGDDAPVESDGTAPEGPTKQSVGARLKGKIAAIAGRLEARNRKEITGTDDERTNDGILPVRLIVGFLPQVKLKDAKEYALGMVDKHFDQPSMSFYGAFEYLDGYAYEAQEGGSGRAYLPGILEHFRKQAAFEAGTEHKVVVQTGTRCVEVQRTREGVAAILLPESYSGHIDSEFKTSKPLVPVFNRRKPFLMAGLTLFMVGVFSLVTTGLFFRFQPKPAEPEVQVEVVSAKALPRTQWDLIKQEADRSVLKELKYSKGAWSKPKFEAAELTGAPPSSATTSGYAAAPGASK